VVLVVAEVANKVIMRQPDQQEPQTLAAAEVAEGKIMV
jgi:hypothetical protein